jgi:transmembrane sensor
MTDKFEVVKLRPEPNSNYQAADWLAKLDRGDLSSDERARFEKWLAENPKNKEEIKAAANFWYGLNAPLSQYGARAANNPRAWSQAAGKTSLLSALSSLIVRRVQVMASAGAIFAFAAIAFVAYNAGRPMDETAYYSTNIGESRNISLSDGSSATLNTNSILEQNFSKEQRTVRLVSGEAVFDVAHDEARPFLVYAADGVIRAVGTRFAVRVEPDNVSVTVTEGKVELVQRAEEREDAAASSPLGPRKPASPVAIAQGEAGEISRTDGVRRQTVTERDVAERLSWANGQLVFYDRELQSVVDEVSRYTPVSILFEDEALKKRKITGVVQIGGVDEMLDAIEGSLDVKARRVSPELIYLTAG